MSTKSTICHGPNNHTGRQTPPGVDFHIFYEMFDEDNIYLELVNCPYFETAYSEYHKGIRTTIAIPGKLWNHIVGLGELKSWGGEDFSNPKSKEQRQKEFDEGLEQTLEMFKSMKQEREAKKDAEAEGESL